jgi:hypothetical protein
MMRRQADLAITAAAALLACVSVALGAPVAITALLGIVLLTAPGYLLGQLLFDGRLAGLERLSVLTGLTLCVPIFGGLLLFAAGLPLHRATWLGLLGGTTLACDLALLLRRRRGGAAAFSWPRLGKRLPTRHAVAFGAAIVITVCAVGVARAGVAFQRYPGFTQLWLAHPDENAATADLGVGNYSGATTRYRLILLHNKRVVASWNLTLANGQTWQRSPAFNGTYIIGATLYRLPDLTHPYRHVFIEGEQSAAS